MIESHEKLREEPDLSLNSALYMEGRPVGSSTRTNKNLGLADHLERILISGTVIFEFDEALAMAQALEGPVHRYRILGQLLKLLTEGR